MNFDIFAKNLAAIIEYKCDKRADEARFIYSCDVWNEDNYDRLIRLSRLADAALDAVYDVEDALYDKRRALEDAAEAHAA